MGVFDAISKAISSTLDDQMKEVIKPASFDEYSVLVPGVTDEDYELEGSLANGSIIYVPENVCAIIYNNQMIENTISNDGAYVYEDGNCSLFNGDGIKASLFENIGKRIGFDGERAENKTICYVNQREIRNIRFGTVEPILYHDPHYNMDLELSGYGSFAIRITDPVKFVTEFVPTVMVKCNINELKIKKVVISEILRELKAAINSDLAQKAVSGLSEILTMVENKLLSDSSRLSEWKDLYGFEVTHVNVEHLDYSPESKELIRTLNAEKLKTELQRERTNAEVNVQKRLNSSYHEQFSALEKLNRMHDAGYLTDEEYSKAKKNLLGI